MRFARIDAGFVAEIIVIDDDREIEHLFHPDLVAACRPCGDEVVAGWSFDGELFALPSGPDLAAVKIGLKAAVDAEAERQRLRYLTGGAAQAMTYARKVEQARAVQADADPQPEDYPLLAASIGIDGDDIQAVAATILGLDAAWEQIGAAIEAVRLTAKRAIDLAEDVEAAQAVEAIWPA